MMTKSEKIVLFLLAFIQFVHIVDFMIMMPLGPQLMRIFDIQPRQFSWLVSSYTFSAGTMSIASAFFIDKFDRKRSFVVFLIGFTIGTLACAFAKDYTQLLMARIVTGFFGGILSSMVLSIVSDLVPPQERGTAMGIVSISFSLASIFGVPFSIFLATRYNWHSPFLFLGIVSAVFVGLVLRFIPPMNKHLLLQKPESSFKHVMKLFTEPHPRRAMLFVLCLMTGQFAIIPFLSPFLVANTGIAESQLPIFYFVGGICSIIVSPWVGRMADRLGKQKVATYALLVSIPIMLFITSLGEVGIGVVVLAFALFFTASGARMVTSMAIVTTTVTTERRGAFMSLISSIQQFSAALGSMLAGIVVVRSADGHLNNYFLTGCMAAVMTLVSVSLMRRIKPAEVATF